jgi:hypothetical protein
VGVGIWRASIAGILRKISALGIGQINGCGTRAILFRATEDFISNSLWKFSRRARAFGSNSLSFGSNIPVLELSY